MMYLRGLWLGLFMTTCCAAWSQLADTPNLRLVTVASDKAIRVSLDRALLIHDIVLTSVKGTDTIVEVTQLTGPAVVDLKCSVDTQPCTTTFKLGPNASKTVRLSASLPVAGTYSAYVTAVAGGERLPMQLVVMRAATAFPAVLAASAAAGATYSDNAKVHIALREHNDASSTLYAPSVTLARRDPGKTVLEDYSYTAVVSRSGTELSGTWTLAPRESLTLDLDLANLKAAGEYVGRVSFSSPESAQVLDVPVTVMRKWPWWVAALLIGAGALAAFAMNNYLKAFRPRLVSQLQAAGLQDQLNDAQTYIVDSVGALQSHELRIFRAVQKQVGDVREQALGLGDSQLKPLVAQTAIKIALWQQWVVASRAAQVLAPDAETAKSLQEMADALEKGGAVGADLQKKFDELCNSITKARQKVEDQVKAQATALESALSVTQAPLGFNPQQWKQLADQLRGELDRAQKQAPDVRVTAVTGVCLQYLKEVHAALRKLADYSAAQAANLSPQDVAAIQDVVKRLDEAGNHLESGDLDKSATLLKQTGTFLRSFKQNHPGMLGGAQGTSASEELPKALDSSAFTALAGQVMGLDVQAIVSKPKAALERLVRRWDLITFVLAVAASLALGLNLLWVGNSAWGTASDLFTALLWGLGVQGVANVAFEGVGGVAARFAK